MHTACTQGYRICRKIRQENGEVFLGDETLPSVSKLLLMLLPSVSRMPLEPVLATFSDPAKSELGMLQSFYAGRVTKQQLSLHSVLKAGTQSTMFRRDKVAERGSSQTMVSQATWQAV